MILPTGVPEHAHHRHSLTTTKYVVEVNENAPAERKLTLIEEDECCCWKRGDDAPKKDLFSLEPALVTREAINWHMVCR